MAVNVRYTPSSTKSQRHSFPSNSVLTFDHKSPFIDILMAEQETLRHVSSAEHLQSERTGAELFAGELFVAMPLALRQIAVDVEAIKVCGTAPDMGQA